MKQATRQRTGRKSNEATDRPGVALLSFVLLFLTSTCCQAERAQVFTEPLAPLHFVGDGEVRGIGTDIVCAIFKEAGIEPHIEIYPWKRALQEAVSREGSFLYTLRRTPEREKLFKWIGPILSQEVHLYRLKERRDIRLERIEDAGRYTTAVILGHSPARMFVDLGFREGRELIVTPDAETQIKVFLRGRCDLVTGSRYTIHSALKAQGRSLDDVEPALRLFSADYYLGAHTSVANDVVERLRRANDKVQQSGVVADIVDRYLE